MIFPPGPFGRSFASWFFSLEVCRVHCERHHGVPPASLQVVTSFFRISLCPEERQRRPQFPSFTIPTPPGPPCVVPALYLTPLAALLGDSATVLNRVSQRLPIFSAGPMCWLYPLRKCAVIRFGRKFAPLGCRCFSVYFWTYAWICIRICILKTSARLCLLSIKLMARPRFPRKEKLSLNPSWSMEI